MEATPTAQAPAPTTTIAVRGEDGEADQSQLNIDGAESATQKALGKQKRIRMKDVDLKFLWSRAEKKAKTTGTSMPDQQHVETNIQMNSPTVHLQVNTDTEVEAEVVAEIQENSAEIQHEEIHENNEAIQNQAVYDVDWLPHDPGDRISILDYDVNDQAAVRGGYITLGPCQPRRHDFPKTFIGGKMRRFVPTWFDKYDWLEYSVKLDAAFCFVCYLFKDQKNTKGGNIFVRGGFKLWNHPIKLEKHDSCKSHRKAWEKHDLFSKTSIDESFHKQSTYEKVKYRARLTYPLKCLRFLMKQGLPCRGHDESDESLNKGNFLELLNWLAEKFEEVNKVVLKNAPKNCKMTSHMIQKQLINCCAKETTKLIMEDLGDDYFTILADESSDVYQKEQLALCLRYVDKKGKVVERFLGVVHMENTTSLTLKNAIETLLMDHSLSLSRIRGQGYDGASNMKGSVSGLKKLIMDELPSAYYVHCFAHQLQLTLVVVAKENRDCVWFFEQLGLLLNAIGNSCKRLQMLRVAHANQVIEAQTVLNSFESFDFVFMAHLLDTIFGYIDDLNCALQRRDQDILNAVSLIGLTKTQLELLREDDGWEKFLAEVTSFCVSHKVPVSKIDGRYKPVGRSKRYFVNVTNHHRFKVEMFLSVIDRQLQELNDRFDEVNTDLLICMSSFSPSNSFSSFDKNDLVKLAMFYPKDFTTADLRRLSYQLENFITDMRSDERFRTVKNISELSIKLVETNKHVTYPFVYKLLKLVLLLPVATASVERVFLAMNFVKNKLRNSMGDQYLNDCLVTFIEREFFLRVCDEDIISRFQKPPRRVNMNSP